MHIIAQKSVYIYPRYGKLIKNTNDSCTVRCVSLHPLGMLGIATFQKEQTFWLSRHCEGSLLPVAIRYSIMFALRPCLPP